MVNRTVVLGMVLRYVRIDVTHAIPRELYTKIKTY